MNDEINYKNNPLHGVGLKTLLVEIVDHYGFEILFAYLNINCFKVNPSIDSSMKFLKKTTWAREKVEVFYLYEFKNLPSVSSEQFSLPPRDRVIPEDHVVGEPAELNLEDAEQLRVKREAKSAEWEQGTKHSSDKKDYQKPRHGSDKKVDQEPRQGSDKKVDPWANWKSK